MFLLVTAFAACGQPGRKSSERADTSHSPVPADSAHSRNRPTAPTLDRAATRLDTMQVEGMPDTITLHLFRTTAGFGLPFSTYVPRDMIAEADSSAGGQAVRFVANFDGQRNDSVQIAVRAYPEGTTEAQARAALVAALGGNKVVREPDRMTSWAEEEYDLQDLAFTGSGMLGRHGGRLFHVVLRYPSEYADGFGPRALVILNEWRWTDDGRPLGK